MRTTIFVIITFLKAVIIIYGLFQVFKNINRSRKGERGFGKSIKFFLIMVASLIGLTLLEFLIAYLIPASA